MWTVDSDRAAAFGTWVLNHILCSDHVGKLSSELVALYRAEQEKIESDSKSDSAASSKHVPENWIKFNFNNNNDFVNTKPALFLIDGEDITAHNWRQQLFRLVEREIALHNPKLEGLNFTSLIGGKPFFVQNKAPHHRRLSNGYWLNVAWNNRYMLKFIALFCQRCGYTQEQLEIYGVPKDRSQ